MLCSYLNFIPVANHHNKYAGNWPLLPLAEDKEPTRNNNNVHHQKQQKYQLTRLFFPFRSVLFLAQVPLP